MQGLRCAQRDSTHDERLTRLTEEQQTRLRVYEAQADWLRNHPHGVQAKMTRDKLRREERALEAEGIDVEAWLESEATRLGLSAGWLAFFHDRPGQPLASTC